MINQRLIKISGISGKYGGDEDGGEIFGEIFIIINKSTIIIQCIINQRLIKNIN